MTRCYDFYAPIIRELRKGTAFKEIVANLPYCKDKCATSFKYIRNYCLKLIEKGVTGDKTKEDRERFEKVANKIGSERKATRGHLGDHRIRGTRRQELPCPACGETLVIDCKPPNQGGHNLKVYKVDATADIGASW